MATLYTKAMAVKELPFIEDYALYSSVDLALWLYLDKHWSFKAAINKAAEKHRIKPKVAIERMLRQVIPEEVFLERASSVSRIYPTKNTKDSIVGKQKVLKMEKLAKEHYRSI